ncbi:MULTISPECIES: hypothetical protein [Rhizobium]|uniref:hypothetical protein n=1 Tax=Rhizobium TaxID=379 RepID=UPI001C900829|nr:hypothetical protein [Rhizobium leguminosarum]MBY2910191.1 hypothetical protein [Rhizobium leguminosarum]
MEKSKKPSKAEIERDARGQSESNHAGGSNNGVSSAKPRVITHSDDATVNTKTPGKDGDAKDWDLNYDERDMNESEFRG